ncbi:MAG: transporter substrate-binding domain-containing protein [Candidatus Izemoplasma sp.]|nr:transporter substrate-binding domain-containing protein [Candidatus Izemoplasma sp.]
MKKIILGLLLLLTLNLASCETKQNTITVLTSSGYEPYEMIDTDGNLTGFDIDLMNALADELAIEIEWKDVAFEGIIASLQSGQAEIAIAGISPTEDRKENIDFSEIYYNSDVGLTNFLVFKSDQAIESLNDLSGLVVGAQLGTVQATLLESIHEEYNFIVDLRNTNTQIVEEIKADRIDVLVVEKVISDSILASNNELKAVGFESHLDDYSGNAIAFSKGSPYVEQFNSALQTLRDNGTLDELINKWFNT